MARRWALAIAVLIGAAIPAGPAPAARAAPFPDDPFGAQWNLARIGAPAAWAKGTGGGVIIGIVDTGIALDHADLAGKVVASTDCIGANDDPAACHGIGQDNQGHGTAVAGIAAADTNNGIGVAGVAPAAKLVVAQALTAAGSGAVNDVNAAVKWVVDHGARVVNLSVEADSGVTALSGQSLSEGVAYAWDHGAVAVVAAGNATPSLLGGSGAYASANAVVVGATGPADEVAPYSSPLTGAKWGLVAPGGDASAADGQPSCAGPLAVACIVSTGWFAGQADQYSDDEGTSMAAPHVAGALAVLLGSGVGLGRDAAISRLLSTVAPVSCGPGCHGRLDLAAAVGVSRVAAAPLVHAGTAGRSASPSAAQLTPGTPAAGPTRLGLGADRAVLAPPPATGRGSTVTVAGGARRKLPGGGRGVPTGVEVATALLVVGAGATLGWHRRGRRGIKGGGGP
jgi:subtilisin family serine protease